MDRLRFSNPRKRVRRVSNYVIKFFLYIALLIFVKNPSLAQTTTIDFDPPQFTAGQQIQTLGIIKFPDTPAIFTPNSATTFTPPNALRSSQVCSNTQCSSGAYMLRMYFTELVSAVSVRAGNFGTASGCFPENATCSVAARLEGFDVTGNVVKDSGDVQVGDAWHGDITTEVAIADPLGRIAYAILFMGKGTAHSDYGNPVPAQIDHLSFTSTGIPTPTAGTPPSIAIITPTPQQSFSYPYQVTFSGKVSTPAGLSAFCWALNNPMVPPSNQCNQVGSLDLNGNFSIGIQPQDLAPGTNTLSGFVYDLANQSATATVTFTLQAPPPPSIVILEPTADYCIGGVVRSGVCWLNSASNIKITGSGTVPGGLLAFCVGANEPVPPLPGQCNQTTQFFDNVPVPAAMLVPGLNTLDAFAYDRWGQLAQAHVNVVLPADPQIVAMEVTQGIQTVSIPLNTPGSPVAYNGVRLFAGGKTVVRVFANTVAGTLPDVDVLLLGTRDQYDAGVQNQFLGVLFPDNGNFTLNQGGTTISLAERADPNGAYVFTLPSDWVSGGGGSITLYAVVNPQGFDIPPVPSCPGCQANSMMTLTDVSFDDLNPITISPVAITWMDSRGAHTPNSDPTAVFASAGRISPLSSGGLNVLPFLGTMDISDLVSFARNDGLDTDWLRGQVLDRVSEIEDIHNPPGYLIGVIKADFSLDALTDLGLENHHLYSWPPRISPIAVVDELFPLTGVAHEFFHQLNYYHAGMSCPNTQFPAIEWPPDDRGDIQGIGLDRRSGSGPVPGTYRIIAPKPQLPEVVDFLSYCTQGESNAWISVRNWNAWGSLLPNGIIPCDLRFGCANAAVKEQPVPANQETLRVKVSVDPTGNAAILGVGPGDGRKLVSEIDPSDHSGYNIVVRDVAGQIVSRTPVSPIASDRWMYFNAEVLAPDAAKVEIERNGSVVAERNRSPHAPTITLLSPGPNTQLSGASPIVVKWQAQDMDGDPLSVRVEYSADGGKSYRVLTAGVKGDQVALPGSLFSRSQNARIRVRVNDGFNEGLAVSGHLNAVGSPPTVRILEPVAGTHYRNDIALHFVGQAYDDAGDAVPADELKWYDGDRFLGQGRQLAAFDREPGHRTIRLVARDNDREAAASVDVYVDAVAPRFVGLRIPQAVDHSEDEMRLTVGSSIPGVLVIEGRGYPVESKPRALTVPIPKGNEDLTLPLVLVAEGKTATIVARIERK